MGVAHSPDILQSIKDFLDAGTESISKIGEVLGKVVCVSAPVVLTALDALGHGKTIFEVGTKVKSAIAQWWDKRDIKKDLKLLNPELIEYWSDIEPIIDWNDDFVKLVFSKESFAKGITEWLSQRNIEPKDIEEINNFVIGKLGNICCLHPEILDHLNRCDIKTLLSTTSEIDRKLSQIDTATSKNTQLAQDILQSLEYHWNKIMDEVFQQIAKKEQERVIVGLQTLRNIVPSNDTDIPQILREDPCFVDYASGMVIIPTSEMSEIAGVMNLDFLRIGIKLKRKIDGPVSYSAALVTAPSGYGKTILGRIIGYELELDGWDVYFAEPERIRQNTNVQILVDSISNKKMERNILHI